MAQTPSDLLAELEDTINRLGDPKKAYWAPENGDLEALPDEPTLKQLRDAVEMARADTSEALHLIMRLIQGQQNQVVFLDKFVKGHRHKVGEGHFSDRADP